MRVLRTARATKRVLCVAILVRRVAGAHVFLRRCARWGGVRAVAGRDSPVVATDRVAMACFVPEEPAQAWPRVEVLAIPVAWALCATQAQRARADFALRVGWTDSPVVPPEGAKGPRRVWEATAGFRLVAT
jgi:hypothetical protein